MRSDDDTMQTWVSPYPNVNRLVLLQKQVTETPVATMVWYGILEFNVPLDTV